MTRHARKPLTVDDHRLFGLHLYATRQRWMAHVNRYPKQSRFTGRLVALEKSFSRLACVMDDVACTLSEDDFVLKLYYPGSFFNDVLDEYNVGVRRILYLYAVGRHLCGGGEDVERPLVRRESLSLAQHAVLAVDRCLLDSVVADHLGGRFSRRTSVVKEAKRLMRATLQAQFAFENQAGLDGYRDDCVRIYSLGSEINFAAYEASGGPDLWEKIATFTRDFIAARGGWPLPASVPNPLSSALTSPGHLP